ncbi:MAG: alpha/beta hydrolase [Patescibacteria group bacterium]
MRTILIIHGIGGHAGIHWQKWLADEHQKLGYTVLMPEMPEAVSPDRNEWLSTIKNLLKDVELKDLIIAGHSLGVTTALDFIEQSDQKINGLVSVSGFAEDYGADLNGEFLKQKSLDFKKITDNLSWASVLYGDDDPYVTQEALAYVADSLGVEPIVLANGGHLNSDTGYNTFPRLLELIGDKQ